MQQAVRRKCLLQPAVVMPWRRGLRSPHGCGGRLCPRPAHGWRELSASLDHVLHWTLSPINPKTLSLSFLQVTSTRRGLRNQLKTLLWRKASPTPGAQGGRESPRPSSSGGSGSGAGWATPPSGGSAGGPAANAQGALSAASVEGQMRTLADLAFLMQARPCAVLTTGQW